MAINPARITPGLKRPPTAHRLLYIGNVVGPISLRLAVDGRHASADGTEKSYLVAFGAQWELQPSPAWLLYVGFEARYAYHRVNGDSNRWHRYGAHPVAGALYYVDPHFSIGTELALDFIYDVYRDPKAFDPAANSEEWTIQIGSLGTLLLGIHF